MIVVTGVPGCSTQSLQPGTVSAPAGQWADSDWQTGDITSTTGAPPAAEVALAGYVFEAQGTQHVIYVGAPDNHVRELWWNINGWHTADLTAAGGGPPAARGGSVAGYAFEAQGTEHVIFTGADGHLHELWSDRTGWHAGDLTAATGAPPPAPGPGGVTGYAFETQGTQHVIFTGADGHLHELWSDRTGWHAGDLTAATGAPPPAPGPGGLTGYAFETQGTQHVIFTGADGHLHELWSNRTGWHASDLTAATGTPPPVLGGGSLTGYTSETQHTQHVIFTGVDGHLHELWSDRTIGWHANDLSAATGAPPARAVAGYAFDRQGTEHVIYTGVDHHLYELWWSNGWHLGDLTMTTGAPPCGADLLVGYAFEVQGTQHVAYISAGDADIHELWWGPRVGSAPQSGGPPVPSGAPATPSDTNAHRNVGQAPR
jgi:hypothetical protein